MLDQGLTVRQPLLRLTQTIQLQTNVGPDLNPQIFPQRSNHQDQFGIDVRTVKPHGFGTHLVELTITPLLRPFVPKHRADVVQPFSTFVQKRVLVDGTEVARLDSNATTAQDMTSQVFVLPNTGAHRIAIQVIGNKPVALDYITIQ